MFLIYQSLASIHLHVDYFTGDSIISMYVYGKNVLECNLVFMASASFYEITHLFVAYGLPCNPPSFLFWHICFCGSIVMSNDNDKPSTTNFRTVSFGLTLTPQIL